MRKLREFKRKIEIRKKAEIRRVTELVEKAMSQNKEEVEIYFKLRKGTEKKIKEMGYELLTEQITPNEKILKVRW